ncbi:Golgi transport complex subunit 3 [Lecanicillium sp. MT-2017a]|nr:Golgi transport complex subunit 3 [Lecanicillium sp. MT-2017a]
MYEDSWYSFVPELTARKPASTTAASGHRRRESLLQQPNGIGQEQQAAQPLNSVAEDTEEIDAPPEPSLPRRAASYSDFYEVVKAQLHEDGRHRKPKKTSRKNRTWEALMLGGNAPQASSIEQGDVTAADSYDYQLLEGSQREYLLYRDQLQLTERHLGGLIDDANATLELLTQLSNSFQSVEAQTSTFQSQCEEVLNEQKKLEKLADEVGTDYYYYSYLDTATRRLNAPGAGRLVDDESFGEMLDNIDACIAFMEDHENYRERDSYLARYNALLTKALHLLDHGFTSRLEKISAEISRQITATKSESTRHALAFGRYEEMILDSYSLLPNVQKVTRRVFDQYGRLDDSVRNSSVYASSALGMFRSYLTNRDRDAKVMTQHDVEEFQKEVKSLSVETASRNLVKQVFERIYNENSLFVKVFGIEPVWSTSSESVFQALKTIQTAMVHPGNLIPLATPLQASLQTADLQAVCNVVGWMASEYGISESDEEDVVTAKQYREYGARLLVEHLWPFVDSAFDAEISKSITKAPLQDDTLKIGPVVDGIASSNAHPLVKRAVELLAMFDHAMPKERSSQNSPVVFSIVRETIQVLQQAASRIQSLKLATDADLFMVKNLLIIKNELVSLEIGDIRSQPPSMQHFGQIWDTLSPQNWVGFIGNILGGQLWARGAPAVTVTAKTLTVEDMSEQLDELLRQSIYGFTRRWGTLVNDANNRKPGAKPIAKVESEMETILQTAFSNQPEVIAKLKEAIEQNAEALANAKDEKK